MSDEELIEYANRPTPKDFAELSANFDELAKRYAALLRKVREEKPLLEVRKWD